MDLNYSVRRFGLGFVSSIPVGIIELLLLILFAQIFLQEEIKEIKDIDFGDGSSEGDPDADEKLQKIIDNAKHTVHFQLFVLVVAYIVAGVTEEVNKFLLTTHTQRNIPGYSHINGIAFFGVISALGFSYFENIEYLTSLSSSLQSKFVYLPTSSFICTSAVFLAYKRTLGVFSFFVI